MVELDKRTNVIQSLKAVVLIIIFLGASGFFAWWGYGLTGNFETWGETIWEKYNWVGSLVFGVGITAGALFVVFFFHRLLLRLTGLRAEGTIINVTKKRVQMETRSDIHRDLGDSNPNLRMNKKEMVTVYRKMFRYIARDGKTYELDSNVETNQPLEEGQKVTVLYRPRHPERAILFIHLEYYALVYLFLIFGIVASVIGAIMLELLD
ncbi:MAG: DUF3592 domain-containing protein [Spirochaetales bacterium]|nr:DUF3592 domain-containing protein [Spirochaetales bacterium]